MTKLRKGDLVRTPQLNMLGYYEGASSKGHRVSHRTKGREVTVITKRRPVKVKMSDLHKSRVKRRRR